MKKYYTEKAPDGWAVKEEGKNTLVAAFCNSGITDAEKLAKDFTANLNTAERITNCDRCYNALSDVINCTHNFYEGVKLLQSHLQRKHTLPLDIYIDGPDNSVMQVYLYNHFERLRKAVAKMPSRELMEDAMRFKEGK